MTYQIEATIAGTKYAYPDGPKLPGYDVIFRANGALTFHLGLLGDVTGKVKSPTAFNIKSHHVKITDVATGTIVFERDIPDHYWNSQWTYRPGPIAVVRTPKQIADANRMFVFGKVPNMNVPGIYPRRPFDIMGRSWVTGYMPTTGERPDIGLVTDAGAFAMMGLSATDLLDAGQAGGSFSYHYRDEAIGKPINLLLHKANRYSAPNYLPGVWLDSGPPRPATGTVFLADGVTLDPNAPGYDRGSDGWHEQGGGVLTFQIAHLCEMSYLAHQFTQDLVFLEDLQYAANACAMGDDGVWDANNIPILMSEYRGIAWGLRTIAMAFIATRDAEAAGILPSTCHPSSYYKTILDAILKFYTALSLNSPDPSVQAFRLMNAAGRFGPWQHEYLMLALSFLVLVGLTEWISMYLWCLKNTVDRTSGLTEYPVGYGGAYYLNTVRGQGNVWPKANGVELPGKPADWGTKYLTWKECFEDLQLHGVEEGTASGLTQAQYDALLLNPFNNGKAVVGGEYLQNTHAVLTAAAYIDFKKLAFVKAIFPQLDTCIANVNRMLIGSTFPPRSSIVNDPSAAPVVITPLPPGPPLPSDPGHGDPGAPPPPVVPKAPGPNMPPDSYAFDAPSPNNAVTSLNTVYVNLAGKIENGANHLLLNVRGNGFTYAEVDVPGFGGDWFHRIADTKNGEIVISEQHATGDQLHFSGCAGIIVNGFTHLAIPVVPPLPDPDSTPTPKPTTGEVTMSAPALNAPFTATVHFLDANEVERAVDSVDWSATGAAKLSSPGHGNTVSGTYDATGAFELQAVGHLAGSPDIVGKVGGTVPVPFPTHARIDLS